MKQEVKTPDQLRALVTALSTGFSQVKTPYLAKQAPAVTVDTLGEQLKVLLGSVAQVIHPKIAVQYRPMHDDITCATQGTIFYAQLIHQHCLVDQAGQRVLTKPLVMMLANQNVWSVVVVLPAQYQPLMGAVQKKSAPLFFFFSPTSPHAPQVIPKALLPFYQILTRGTSQRVHVQGEIKTLKVIPPFPQAHFYNGSAAFPSHPEDSASWCLYAALMSVVTGCVPQVPSQSPDAVLHWRKILAETLQTPSAQLQAIVIAQLQAYHTRQHPLAKPIIEALQRLVKYGLLSGYRARYPAVTEQLDHLAQCIAHDKRVKSAIYAMPLTEPNDFIPYLSHPTLLHIARLKSEPEKLFTHLQQQATQQLAALRHWQADRQDRYQDQIRTTSCLQRTRHRLRAFVTGSYWSSYLGLGDMLFGSIGEPLKEHIPPQSLQSVRQIAQKVARWSAYFTTASTARADQASQWVGRHLVREQIPPGFRVIGAGIGFAYAYYSGLYATIRLLSLGWIGRTVVQQFAQPQINDLSATVHSSPYLPGVAGVTRLTSVAFTVAESAYQGTYVPILCALGGITGSETARHLAQRSSPQLQQNPDTVEAARSRAGVLLLVSLLGYEMGQRLMLGVYRTIGTIVSKEAAQAYAVAQLQALAADTGVHFMDIQHPNIRRTPSLWWNTDNPIQVTSIDLSLRLREVNCQIQPIEPFALDCDEPIIADTARLME